MRIEWGNAAQWVSAICALALAGLAIYGLLFSQTSQVFVQYLQTELALRNVRLAQLEDREKELQASIAAAQSDLTGLSEQKTELEKQVATLKSEQDKFSKRVEELVSALSGTEFSLVREKITVKFASGFSAMTVLRLQISTDWMREGVRAQTLRPWDFFLDSLKRSSSELAERDQPLARVVVDKFIQQCGRYSGVTIQIPAMRVPPNTDFSAYGNDRRKHPLAIRAEAVNKQIEKIEDDMEACFKAVTP